MKPADSHKAPPEMAGLLLDRLTDANSPPLIMGVVNVTPDSFSDGGRFFDAGQAIAHGLRLVDEGADILDIGGESTRPGAEPVGPEAELARILPVIEGLRATRVPLSVDTRHAPTMRAVAQRGAALINDVSGLTFDPAAAKAVSESGLPVVLMHAQGTPETMQRAPEYQDVLAEVVAWLKARAEAAMAAGIGRGHIVLDPGIGFGKTLAHNVALMQGLDRMAALGFPLLVGLSRKSLIDGLSGGGTQPHERLPGSLAGALFALERGARILRVHDVAATRQAIAVWQGLAKPRLRSGPGGNLL